MTEEGLSFDEASEVVRGSTVFTTHTPVEAGNERFSKELIEHYFANFVKWTGISWSQFWELGTKESGEGKPFFMTILALKMAHKSNAVSRLHGQVSRRMWREVWKGFDESDIPIGHVTNGAHVLSYIAPRMKELLDTYLGMDWDRHISDPERWARIQDIPDTVLWRTRYELRQKMIDFLRDDLSRNWMKYGYSKTWQEELFAKINPAALMIGFARRFAPYKRADMILSDLDRLDRILNHPTRPVHIVFAGKAHPNDEMGKDLIKKVIGVCKDERFRGKIFFVEGYDIRIARHLVQGVDVWLNTPRRPLEASGTSGEKVVANGVLNLSISDGWWVEGYDGTNGWTIGPVVKGYRRRDGQRRRGGQPVPLRASGKQRDPPLLRPRDVRPPREVDRHDQAVDADPRPPLQHGADARSTTTATSTSRRRGGSTNSTRIPTGWPGSWPTGSGRSRCASPPCASWTSASRGSAATRSSSSGRSSVTRPDRSGKAGTGRDARGAGHRKEGRQRLRRTAGVRPPEARPAGRRTGSSPSPSPTRSGRTAPTPTASACCRTTRTSPPSRRRGWCTGGRHRAA